jgi:hypothetical protein
LVTAANHFGFSPRQQSLANAVSTTIAKHP